MSGGRVLIPVEPLSSEDLQAMRTTWGRGRVWPEISYHVHGDALRDLVRLMGHVTYLEEQIRQHAETCKESAFPLQHPMLRDQPL